MDTLKKVQRDSTARISAFEVKMENLIEELSKERVQRRLSKERLEFLNKEVSKFKDVSIHDQLSSQLTNLKAAESRIIAMANELTNVSEKMNMVEATCKSTALFFSKNISSIETEVGNAVDKLDGAAGTVRRLEGKVSTIERQIEEVESFKSEAKSSSDQLRQNMDGISTELQSSSEKLRNFQRHLNRLSDDDMLNNLSKRIAPMVLRESEVSSRQFKQETRDKMAELQEQLKDVGKLLQTGKMPESRNANIDRIDKSWESLKEKFGNRDFMKNGRLNNEEGTMRQEFRFEEPKDRNVIVFPDNQTVIEKLNPNVGP